MFGGELHHEHRRHGPFCLFFTVISLHLRVVPKLQLSLINFCGLKLSDRGLFKLTVLFFATWPLRWYANMWSVAFQAVCGYLAPQLFLSGVFIKDVKNLDLPYLVRVGFGIVGWVFEEDCKRLNKYRRPTRQTVPRNAPGNNTLGEWQEIPRALQQPPAAAAFEPAPAPSPPSDEDVATLVAMGFAEDAVKAALQAGDNNVEVAANRLLSGA